SPETRHISRSVGGMGAPRGRTSLSSACPVLLKPNTSPACAACGLVSFIWPRMAPVTRTGDMPPISAQICFQVQPFSRLMPSSFSVSSARVVADVMTVSLLAAPLPPPQRRPNGTPKTVDHKCSYCRDRDAGGCSGGLPPPRLPPCPLWVISGHDVIKSRCPL